MRPPEKTAGRHSLAELEPATQSGVPQPMSPATAVPGDVLQEGTLGPGSCGAAGGIGD